MRVQSLRDENLAWSSHGRIPIEEENSTFHCNNSLLYGIACIC